MVRARTSFGYFSEGLLKILDSMRGKNLVQEFRGFTDITATRVQWKISAFRFRFLFDFFQRDEHRKLARGVETNSSPITQFQLCSRFEDRAGKYLEKNMLQIGRKIGFTSE